MTLLAKPSSQNSTGNRQLFRNEKKNAAWIAAVPDSRDMYLAVFNLADPADDGTQDAVLVGAAVPVDLHQLGFDGPCTVLDLWKKTNPGRFEQSFAPMIPWHGAGVYRLSPAK